MHIAFLTYIDISISKIYGFVSKTKRNYNASYNDNDNCKSFHNTDHKFIYAWPSVFQSKLSALNTYHSVVEDRFLLKE